MDPVMLVGSIPGVLLGAQMSARAPAALIRAALIVVLVASALKLFNLPNLVVAAVTVVVAVPAFAQARRRRAAAVAEVVPAEPAPSPR